MTLGGIADPACFARKERKNFPTHDSARQLLTGHWRKRQGVFDEHALFFKTSLRTCPGYFFSIVSVVSVVVAPGVIVVSVSVVFSVEDGVAGVMMVVSLVSAGGLMVTSLRSQAKDSVARTAIMR